jgi:hypothetical protein
VTRSLLDAIVGKELKWCGDVQRMRESRLPKQVMTLYSIERKKEEKRQTKTSRIDGIYGMTEEKELTEEGWR